MTAESQDRSTLPMNRAVPRAGRAWTLALGVLVAIGLSAGGAQADDTTAAWSAAPSDAAGVPSGQTRFELEVAAGGTLEQHVLVTNASTVEREFAVYGADGFNTPTGGYDVTPAAQPATDVGAWVAPGTPTVIIPALSTAVVAFTVTVPADATPGDHPGGLVVSPVRDQVTDAGVVVDTRVAVRLNVRVAGEVTAALEVRSVNGSYGFTAVPFGGAPTTVSYEVVNTGNVKVVGVPRLRVTGPFGMTLAEVDAEDLREVLPGDSFTVTTVLDGVAPLVVLTAVVDVEMAAAPGPATDIPLVSSTGRSMVLAVSWTGLVLVLALAVTVWVLLRRSRLRRLHGAREWDRALDDARRGTDGGVVGVAGRGPAAGPAAGATLALVLLLSGAAVLLPAPQAQADETDDGALSLTVPAAPTSVSTPAPTTSRRPSTRTGSGSAATPIPDPGPVAGPDVAVLDDVEEETSAAVGEGPAPDLQWAQQGGGLTPVQWTMVGLAAAAAGAGLVVGGRTLIIGRRGAGAAA